MTKIPKVYSENLNNRNLIKAPEKRGDESFSLFQADALLKDTGQYKRWLRLRQNNDTLAKKTAGLIVKRHNLIEDAKKGILTDQNQFDNLTQKISKYGIFLYDSNQLKRYRYSWSKNIDKNIVLNPSSYKKDILLEKVTDKDLETDIADDELILEVRYKNYIISKGILSLNEDGTEFYPLRGTASCLDTKVTKVAEEIYNLNDYNKNNAVLNLKDKTLKIFNKTLNIKDNDFKFNSGELYLNKDILSKIYNSDFLLNRSEMTLEVKPFSTLPFMEKIHRSQKYLFKNNANDFYQGLPKFDQPYSTYRFPLIDFQGNTGYDSSEDENPVGDYSIKGRGELFKTGVKFFVKGDEDDNPERFDILAERVNPERDSFRDISRVALGDIRHDNFSVFGSTDIEKGIKIESRNLNRPNNFDSTDFIGNLLPGWDVELYRNNVLIAKDTSGDDGKFDFQDIPLFYGENRFKLIYYGPYGEKREEDKLINIGSEMEKTGEISYDLTLSSKEKNTLPFEDEVEGVDYESPRFSGSFNAGVGNRFSIEGGIRSEDIENTRHNYFSAGITGAIFGTLVKGNAFFDDNGGGGGFLLVQSKIDDINIRLKNTYFDKFIKDGTDINDPEKFISEGSFSGLLFKDSKIPVSWSLSEKYTLKEDSYLNSLSFRQGINQGDFSLYNSSIWQKSTSLDSDQLTGSLNSNIKIDDIDIQGETDYEIFPDTELKNISVSGSKHFSKEMGSEVKLKHSFEDHVSSLSGSLGYDSGKWKLSPEVTIDSEGEWKVYTGLGMSIGKDPNTKNYNIDSRPRSPFGEASASVFEDKNLNGVKDEGEKPLEGVRIEAPGTGISAITDENGIALIKRLSPYRKSEISINESTIEDPLMISSNKGHTIYPRPGRVEKMEFPVFSSGEITGKIFLMDEHGVKRELAYENISLESKDGAFSKQIKSEFDGYFVLDRIPPGNYILKSGDSKELLNYEKEILVSESESVGREIILSHKASSVENTEENKDSSVLKRVLYANSRWNLKSGFSPEDKIPDESIMLYENGEWILTGDSVNQYREHNHIASFKDFEIAQNYIKEKSKEFMDKKNRTVTGKADTIKESKTMEKEKKESAYYTGILNIC